MKVAGDCRSTEGHRAGDEPCGDGESEQRAVSMGFGPDHGNNDENRAQNRAGNAHSPARLPLGDDPPAPADHQGQPDQPDDQEAQVADREDHHSHGEEHRTTERCQRK